MPHTFGSPPPPQVNGAAQVPQLVTVRLPPQLSVPLTEPQFFAKREQNCASLSAVQLTGWHTLVELHTSLPLHVPQLDTVRLAPQLSVPLTEPQVFPKREQN